MKKILFLTLAASMLVLAPGSYAQDFSTDDAKELTIKAKDLIEKIGIEKARPILNDLSGGYRQGEKGELYVSVINWDGVWLAYPPRPAGVGKSVLNVKDPDGKYLVKDMISIAKTKGEGWCEYRWLDPKSGKIRPKVAYVVRVGDKDMYVSAGIYK